MIHTLIPSTVIILHLAYFLAPFLFPNLKVSPGFTLLSLLTFLNFLYGIYLLVYLFSKWRSLLKNLLNAGAVLVIACLYGTLIYITGQLPPINEWLGRLSGLM